MVYWAYADSQGLSIGFWRKRSEAIVSVSTKLVYADVLRCADAECKTHVYPERHEDWSLIRGRSNSIRVIKTPRGSLVPFALDLTVVREFEKAAAVYWQWRIGQLTSALRYAP